MRSHLAHTRVVAMVGDVVTDGIAPDDRVTYAEAAEITQRSPGYLLKLVNAGRLSRMGGQVSAAYRTFLSRTEVEALAVREYRRGKISNYWMTMTQVAELAGVDRTAVHQARQTGRLTAFQTPTGDWLVRRTDAQRYHLDRQLTPLSTGWRKQEATIRDRRSTMPK